jgi:bacteriorhodopsin
MHSLGGILLGLINICIVVAILVLIGYIIVWLFSWLGFAIPPQVQKIYMVIVALIALYMIVQLLLGVPGLRIIGSNSFALGYG